MTRRTLVKVSFCMAASAGLMFVARTSAQTVTHVSAGIYHSIFSKSDGSLWGMGGNFDGQLGLGFAPSQTNLPQEILTNGVGLVAAGGGHSLFQSGHTVWAMGFNYYGQLGDGTTNNHYFPEQVYSAGSSKFGISPIAAGTDHSLFGVYPVLSGSGSFSGMGFNENGDLGDGTLNDTNKPVVIQITIAGYAVTAAAAGSDFSFFIKPNTSLWGMGDNLFGQLGDGQSGTYTNLPEMIIPSSVTAVAAGGSHSLFIKSDGSLWGMGYDGNGQLGDNKAFGTTVVNPEQLQLNGVIAVAAGGSHSLFIKSDGSLWAMGGNAHGQLGDGTTNDQALPERIVTNNVVAVAAGSEHTLFIKSDGSLWGMGRNDSGQLGDGTYNDSYAPEEIVPPPPPTITSIVVSGPDVIVSWPTNQGGFSLQSTTNLSPPTAWVPVSPAPVVVSNQYVVTNPISGPQVFYRLGE